MLSIGSSYTDVIAIAFMLPLIILLMLFMRFYPVVFDLDKKKSNDISLVGFTFFLLLIAFPISILFFPPLSTSICADPTLGSDPKVIGLLALESGLTVVSLYILEKYIPAFKFPIYFITHLIQRTKMTISNEVNYLQLFFALVLTYSGLVVYISLMMGLIGDITLLIETGSKYLFVELILITMVIYPVLHFIEVDEQETKKVVAYVVNRFLKSS